MATPNKRGYYRIEYPIGDRPLVVADDHGLEIIDCSESGLRYALPDTKPRPEVGSDFAGSIRFREATENVEVIGVVARVYGPSVAVRFTAKTIPFSVILAEQRRLRRQYLTHLQDGR